MQKAAQAYLQTQVATTSQGALLLMLYDGAVNFLNQAKEKMAERDYAKKGILISKAIDIVAELDSCLNVERGGDISDNLHRLYFYCNSRLLSANLKMNVAYIDEVIKILEGLRSAYAYILSPGDDAAAKSRLGSQSGAGDMSQTVTSVHGVSAAVQAPQDINVYASTRPFGGRFAADAAGQSRSLQTNAAQAGGYGHPVGMGAVTAAAPATSGAPSAPAFPGRENDVTAQLTAMPEAAAPSGLPAASDGQGGRDETAADSGENAEAAKPAGQQGFARSNAANMYKRLSGQL